MKAANVWQQISAADGKLCLLLNRAAHQRPLAALFRTISRIGDGVFWYALMVVLPVLYGQSGWQASLLMVITGAINLIIYRSCKGSVSRERPFISLPPIHLAGVPLDRYSFPSGHTQHAVGFTVIAVSLFPPLGMLLYPFTALVALSRPLLGLHYPSDVLIGALLGYGVATGVLVVYGFW